MITKFTLIERLRNGRRGFKMEERIEAADALEAQARRIAELETEIGKHVMRVFALMDLLPDATLCGELQEATARRHEMPIRIAELKAALKPFADKATVYPDLPDNWLAHVTMKHLRAARAAYLGETKE